MTMLPEINQIYELCKEPPDALWKALLNLSAIKRICEQPQPLESAAREIAREHWKQRLLYNLPDLKPHEVEKLMDDASEDIESWGALLERHLHSAAQPPAIELKERLSQILTETQHAKEQQRITLEMRAEAAEAEVVKLTMTGSNLRETLGQIANHKPTAPTPINTADYAALKRLAESALNPGAAKEG